MKPQLSLSGDLGAINSRVKKIGARTVLRKKAVVQRLIDRAKNVSPECRQELLELAWEMLEEECLISTFTARDASVVTIADLFGLKVVFGEGEPWDLAVPLLPVPADLTHQLNKLQRAHYDPDCEATCRIRVDTLLIEASIAFFEQLERENKPSTADTQNSDGQQSHTAPFTSRPTQPPPLPPPPQGTPTKAPRLQELVVHPDLDLDIEVISTGNKRLRVSGKADWGVGYGNRSEFPAGSLLIAVEAKKASALSEARTQLLMYLAVIRQLRLQEGKPNVTVQGFFSDGIRYTFMALDNLGRMLESHQYNTRHKGHLSVIYNWTIALMRTAVQSSPNTSPTKPEEVRDAEIEDYPHKVFCRYYENHVDDLEVDEDDDCIIEELE